jgi:alpha-L-fucosidase
MTLNTTWGYSEHDHAWKDNRTLIRNLVDIASKGGNYLLNIGPTGDGSVPEPSVKSMKAIGAWMKVNHIAIYGTTANPIGEVPWGRITAKGTTVYLHVFDAPADGVVSLPWKAAAPKARLLADPAKPVAAELAEGVLRVKLAGLPLDPNATVIELAP